MLTVIEWPDEYKESFIKVYGTVGRLKAATDADFAQALKDQKIPTSFAQEAKILKRWVAAWWLKPRNERAPITLCFDEDEWHDALATYENPVNVVGWGITQTLSESIVQYKIIKRFTQGMLID